MKRTKAIIENELVDARLMIKIHMDAVERCKAEILRNANEASRLQGLASEQRRQLEWQWRVIENITEALKVRR